MIEAYKKLRAWSHRQNPNHVFMLDRLSRIRKDSVDLLHLKNLVTSYEEGRIVEILEGKSPSTCVLVFNHGLGDFINFLPLYEALKNWFLGHHKFYIAASPSRQFHLIHQDAIPLTSGSIRFLEEVDFVFNIKYPEPPGYPRPAYSIPSSPYDGVSKPYRCNMDEIGLPKFQWEVYKWPISSRLPIRKQDKVGVHFSGNTNAEIKNPTREVASQIWDEIQVSGFDPYEVHMDHFFSLYEKTEWDFIPDDKTFRTNGTNLADMFYSLTECRYFFGVDSGPLYLAVSLLGTANCFGLESTLKFNRYFPDPNFKVIDIGNYKKYSVLSFITMKEVIGT